MNIYGKELELPKFINTETKINFQSLGFDFKVVFTPVDLDLPFPVVNVRIFANKKFSCTMDCTVEFAEYKTEKLERILLNDMFSRRTTQLILDNIYN